jgi:hypothetical protein
MPEESIYENHRLTRRGMEQVIAENGSVLYKGRVLTRVEHLPSEAELSTGDPERAATVRAALDRQIAALQADRASLETPQTLARPQADQADQAAQDGADAAKALAARDPGETKSDAEARALAVGTAPAERRESTATADSPAVGATPEPGVKDNPAVGQGPDAGTRDTGDENQARGSKGSKGK